MIPQQAVIDATAAQAQTGVSDLAAALALAVAGPETGYSYNPSEPGDYMLGGQIVLKETPGAIPTSWGYTQLHTNAGGDGGGVGNGHSVAELTNGVSNLAIAMAEIQRRLNAGDDAYGALEPWSTRDQAIAQLPEAQAALGSDISRGIPGSGVDGAAIALAGILGLAAWVLFG